MWNISPASCGWSPSCSIDGTHPQSSMQGAGPRDIEILAQLLMEHFASTDCIFIFFFSRHISQKTIPATYHEHYNQQTRNIHTLRNWVYTSGMLLVENGRSSKWYSVPPQTSCSVGLFAEPWLVDLPVECGNWTRRSALLTSFSTFTSSLHVSFCAYT